MPASILTLLPAIAIGGWLVYSFPPTQANPAQANPAQANPAQATFARHDRFLHTTAAVHPDVHFEAMERGKMRVRSEKATFHVSIDEIVRYGSLPLGGQFPMLLLVDGSRLTGQLESITADRVVWVPNRFQRMTLSRALVRAIVLRSPGSPAASESLWRRLMSETAGNEATDSLSQDQLLHEATWLSGVLLPSTADGSIWKHPFEDEAVNLATDASSRQLEWRKIHAIRFSPILAPLQLPPSSCLTLGWSDGTLVHAQGIDTDPTKIAWTVRLSLPISLVADSEGTDWPKDIQFLRSKPLRVQFLSDLEPALYRHASLFRRAISMGVNRGLSGSAIRCGGNLLDNGLAMPSPSQASYRWDGSPALFLAQVAWLDNESPSNAMLGSAIAKVLVSRGGPLETVFQSRPLTPVSVSEKVEVDMGGVRLLVLLIESSSLGEIADQVVWLDARIGPK
jgi:hypothetical protein